MKKIKLTELPLCNSTKGLYTIGTDKNNRSVRVPFDYLVEQVGQEHGIATSSVPKIAAVIKDGRLYITNAAWYLERGYYAYVFRHTTKKNRVSEDRYEKYDIGRRVIYRGWNVMGQGYNNIQFELLKNGTLGLVKFRNCNLSGWGGSVSDGTNAYTHRPDRLIHLGYNDKDVIRARYGAHNYRVWSPDDGTTERVFTFGIGFAPAFVSQNNRLEISDLVSNLAQFSVKLCVSGFGWDNGGRHPIYFMYYGK